MIIDWRMSIDERIREIYTECWALKEKYWHELCSGVPSHQWEFEDGNAYLRPEAHDQLQERDGHLLSAMSEVHAEGGLLESRHTIHLTQSAHVVENDER